MSFSKAYKSSAVHLMCRPFAIGVAGNPTSPGTRTGVELNTQALSRKWFPNPAPAIDSTISVVNGLHSVNGGTLQSGAITITAEMKYFRTMVMADADEFEKSTEATQLLSDGARSFTFTAVTRAAIVTPTQFSFTDFTGAELSTVVESDAITIAGLEATASFTVIGGTAEKNDSGTWAASGTVENDDTVKVRGTSSESYSTPVFVVLDVGGVSDTFSIMTKEEPVASDGFPYTFPFTLG